MFENSESVALLGATASEVQLSHQVRRRSARGGGGSFLLKPTRSQGFMKGEQFIRRACTCMHVCIHTYVHAYIHIRIHILMHMRMHIHIHINMHVCMYIYLELHVYSIHV